GHVDGRRENEGQSPADPVTPRAHDKLAKPETHCCGGMRELDERGGDSQVLLECRKRGQGQVNGERPECGERPEHEYIHETLATGKRISGMNDCSHVMILDVAEQHCTGGRMVRRVAARESLAVPLNPLLSEV